MKIGIISDIHSDTESLRKAFNLIEKRHCDKIICLGDIVGYSHHHSSHMESRDPDTCVSMVKDLCDIAIAGNHDLYEITKLPQNFKKIHIPPDWYELDLEQRRKISKGRFWLYDDEVENKTSKKSKEFLELLPETCIEEYDHISILFSHFICPDLTGSTTFSPSKRKDFRDHLQYLKSQNCMLGIAGHAHLEGYAIIKQKELNLYYFGYHKLDPVPQILITPAVTRGTNKNGIITLDTKTLDLEAIPIS